MRIHKIASALGLALALAACSNDAPTAGNEASEPSAATAPAEAPATTGNVIEVRMITNGAENAFVPAQVTAQRGDVVRFVLDSGVHNVSFPASENAGAANLPAASAILATPGQSVDVPVTMAAGEYTFQCDPHVMMGMKGTLTVQ